MSQEKLDALETDQLSKECKTVHPKEEVVLIKTSPVPPTPPKLVDPKPVPKTPKTKLPAPVPPPLIGNDDASSKKSGFDFLDEW